MKEIKVTIKLTVYSDDSDKETLNESIYQELQDQMESESLLYTYKTVDTLDDEEEEELEEVDFE